MTIRLDQVTKRFKEIAAVRELCMEVDKGSFFSVLGPSGCGKTTTLRMIAGFERPDSGEIYLEGQPVSAMPPYRRNVNTVFQSYALFEHLSVWDNVAFGLRRKGVPRPEISARVGEMLERVHLSQRASARPRQLSGGQQQRVALARALVNLPAVLLLDEPLGALDLQLRKRMQLELKHIQQDSGVTFIYVTHDQEEALTMSDRVAVMRGGLLQQVGTPQEVYERPANAFVAGFIGISSLIPATATADGVKLPDGSAIRASVPASCAPGTPVDFAVRPEKITLDATGDSLVTTAGTIVDVIYQGIMTQYVVELSPEARLIAVEKNDSPQAGGRTAGDRVTMGWRPEFGLVLTRQGGDD